MAGKPLILGWSVDSKQSPSFWSTGTRSKSKLDPSKHLVCLSPSDLQAHTAIIAQSGSGKSYFLGRLVEEIALKTRARCLILDPNSDFRRISEAKEADDADGPWLSPKYQDGGHLTHESRREEFSTAWAKVRCRILTAREDTSPPFYALRVSWPALSVDVLAGDLPTMKRLAVLEFHAVVRAVARLKSVQAVRDKDGNIIPDHGSPTTDEKPVEKRGQVDLNEILRDAERYCREFGTDRERLEQVLRDEYKVDEIVEAWIEALKQDEAGDASVKDRDINASTIRDLVSRTVEPAILTIADAVRHAADPEARSYYLGRAARLYREGIARSYQKGFLTVDEGSQIDVIDLPSVGDRTSRLLAVSAILGAELARARQAWERALIKKDPRGKKTPIDPKEVDARAPTFVIIDEAHNLAPSGGEELTDTALAVREQLRTLAAEGRKFGLFLMLVTQSPGQLDGRILSQCENKAIMRHDSTQQLAATLEQLGLADVDAAAVNNLKGRVLLAGTWRKHSTLMYGAARRTVEGGRNLVPELWGLPRAEIEAAMDEVGASDAP